MKNKLLITLKIGILIFILWNCEKETILLDKTNQVENQKQKPTLSIKHIKKETINKNNKLTSKLDKLSKNLKSNKNKKVYNKDYDFVIDTESATYIENGDYHSYTFPIIQGINENITNVLFTLNDQNQYDVFLVTYGYTAEQLKTLNANQLSKRTEMKPIDLDFNSLFSKMSTVHICLFSYRLVDTGDLMGAGNQIYEWVLTASHCEVIHYSENDTGTSNTSNSGSYISGGSNSFGGGKITSPTSASDDEDYKLTFNLRKKLGLSTEQYTWLNGHLSEASQINVFLVKNNWNTETKAFGKSAVEALMNDGEVDFKNEIIYSKAFKATRAYCVIKQLTSTNNNLFADVTSQFTNNKAKNRLIFDYEPLVNNNGVADTKTEANTSPPDPLGSITIRFNSNTNSANDNSLNIAATILHESIHAELFRIVEGNNNVPEPLSADLYLYMVKLLEYYENNGNPKYITSNAQHAFMANNHVGAIANAVRNFDNNTHTIDHYMVFGWEGLSEIGRLASPPLVTNNQMTNYYNLANIPLNDSHKLKCDD